MHPLFQISNASLKQDVQRAALLNLTAQGSGLLLQFVSLIFFARLVTPDHYGVFSMVTPFVAIIMIFGDLGLASAMLQQRDLTEGQASAVLRINVIAGLILGGVFLAGAPLLGFFYHEPRVTPVAAALSPIFLISGLTAVQTALLRRALRFGTLLRAALVGAIVSTVVGVGFAFLGAGYWALTARTLAGPLASSVFLWLSTRWVPPRPQWDATTKSMLRYGKFFVAFLFLNTLGRQGDNVLIGWRYGSIELAPYALAYRFFFLPVQQITAPLGQVLIPTFSRLRDDPNRLKTWYLKTLRLITFCAYPPVFSLVVCADDVIRLLAGPRWDKAAIILQWLAPIGALHVGYTTIGWLMQSQGHSDRNFYWGTISVSAYLAAFLIGLPWGAVGVASAYAVANLVLFLPGFAYGTKGTLIRPLDVLAAMLPSFATAAATLPAVYVVHNSIAVDASPAARLILIAVTLAVMMMGSAILTFGPSALTTVGKDALTLVGLSRGKIRAT